MARLPYLEPEQVAPQYRDMLKRNTNLHKLLVNSPDMARAASDCHPFASTASSGNNASRAGEAAAVCKRPPTAAFIAARRINAEFASSAKPWFPLSLLPYSRQRLAQTLEKTVGAVIQFER